MSKGLFYHSDLFTTAVNRLDWFGLSHQLKCCFCDVNTHWQHFWVPECYYSIVHLFVTFGIIFLSTHRHMTTWEVDFLHHMFQSWIPAVLNSMHDFNSFMKKFIFMMYNFVYRFLQFLKFGFLISSKINVYANCRWKQSIPLSCCAFLKVY